MYTPLAQQVPSIVDADDYAWLRRHCARLAHDDEAGADLTQETLVEAWRNRHKLTDPQGRRAWLAAIAGHVYHRWLRSLQPDTQHLARLDDADAALENALSADDFVHDLERAELATLLDHALALLPGDLRQALIAHYVEELPQNEIAARLGISQGTLAVRLHRGRLRLQRIFATDLRDEAAVFGLDAAPVPDWQETRLWCYHCGQQRLRVRFDRERNQLLVHCPACGPQIDHQTTVIAGARSYRAALERIIIWTDAYYTPAIAEGAARCMGCGRMAPVRLGDPASWSFNTGTLPTVHLECTCNAISTCVLSLNALGSPMGQAFRRAHPRIRLAAQTEMEVGGVDALVLTVASVTDAARLRISIARDTYRILDIQTD
jgi:RNA polymerase sigma factor (sigma-70 family)